MVIDSNRKGNWFLLLLMALVLSDLAVMAVHQDVPTTLWIFIGVIQVATVGGLLWAGRTQSIAHIEHEQFEVMGLILNQLNNEEVSHVLGELKHKDLTKHQKRLIERLINEHCHVEVHL